MRSITVAITELLGNQHQQKINEFISLQFHREADISSGLVTLRDASESNVARVIKSSILLLGLSAQDVFDYMLVAPYMSANLNIEAGVEFSSGIYKSLLSSVASVDVQFIREGDNIEYLGKSKHINQTEVGQGSARLIIGGYINGQTVKDGRPFSILIKGSEWQESVKNVTDKKYNKTLFSDTDWNVATMEAILFRRLIDEHIGSILDDESPEDYLKYRAIMDFGVELFEQTSDLGKKVYSDFGQVIGTTYKEFSAGDKISVSQKEGEIKTSHLSVVVNNEDKSPPTSADSPIINRKTQQYDEVAEEWGQF